MSSETRTIDFRETVPLAQGVEVRRICPINGYVSFVVMHFPPGCNALVQVQLAHEKGSAGGPRTGILPTDANTFLALDNATPNVNLHFPVKRGDWFYLRIRNTDGVNPHTISVDIIINPEIRVPVEAR